MESTNLHEALISAPATSSPSASGSDDKKNGAPPPPPPPPPPIDKGKAAKNLPPSNGPSTSRGTHGDPTSPLPPASRRCWNWGRRPSQLPVYAPAPPPPGRRFNWFHSWRETNRPRAPRVRMSTSASMVTLVWYIFVRCRITVTPRRDYSVLLY